MCVYVYICVHKHTHIYTHEHAHTYAHTYILHTCTGSRSAASFQAAPRRTEFINNKNTSTHSHAHAHVHAHHVHAQGSNPVCLLEQRLDEKNAQIHTQEHTHTLTHTYCSPLNLECNSISISNLNLRSLSNGTWQKRPRELDHRLRFETEETTL